MNTPSTDWPAPMRAEAFHGIAGEFVRLVEPHTEADPVALLVSFLAAAGSAIGAGVCDQIGADRHTARIWPIVVGDSATGRKGTSIGWAREVVALADPSWRAREVGNVGSGEAVIWSVRDPVTKPGKDDDVVVIDPGVTDKRLFVMESEFASVLRVASRDGSVLSPILRAAWDRDDLTHTVKHQPATATGAHITVIGHITPDELRKELRDTERANGFANRFLFVMVRRSKLLPRGGQMPGREMAALGERLAVFLDFARSRRRVGHAPSFWSVYDDQTYEALTTPPPGIVGAMMARGAAHVRRLAMTYALLDGCDLVGAEHASAALAVWDYSAASVRHLFGEVSGDRVRDIITAALTGRPDGLTRTDIRDLFHRHEAASSIDRALSEMERAGVVEMEVTDTGGRPVTRWRARKATKATEGASVASVASVAGEVMP